MHPPTNAGSATPLVSVVIPAYNAAATIETALRSALDQTVREIEVLVVDDGSTDATLPTVQRLLSADDRVQLLRQTTRGGVNRARNAALERARGRWIAVLDADDWYDPERLEILLATNADRYDLIADSQVLHEAERQRVRPVLAEDQVLGPADIVGSKLDMRKRGGLGMLKPVIRKSMLDAGPTRYVESMRVGGDFVFLMDCLARSPRLLLVSRPMYHYRVAAGSLTRSKHLTDIQDLCREVDRLLDLPWDEDREDVTRLLHARRRNAERMADYYALIEMLRARDVGRALATTLRNPRPAAWLLGRAISELASRTPSRNR